MGNLLAVGRAIGVDNVAQIRQFVKAIKNGAKNANMHLDYSQSSILKLVQDNPLIDQNTLARVKGMYPQDSKNIIDVLFQRYGEKSAKIQLNALAKDANGDNIAEGILRLLGNSSGFKLTGQGSGSYQNMAFDIDLSAIRNPNFSIQDWAKKLVEKMRYSVTDGVAKMEVPTVKSNGVSLKSTMKANESLYDEVANIITGGEVQKYGTIIEKGKNKLA